MPDIPALPIVSNLNAGAVVPIPTLPLPENDKLLLPIVTSLLPVNVPSELYMFGPNDAVVAKLADVTDPVIKFKAQLAVAAFDAVVAKLAEVTELVKKFCAQEAVPNNDPVKLEALTGPVTLKDPVILTEPVNS